MTRGMGMKWSKWGGVEEKKDLETMLSPAD